MLNFGNKEFRNLQEQVLFNANAIDALKQGLVIVGVGTALPTTLNNGEAYLIGEEAPYTLYIKVNGQLLNMGAFPSPGPQGPQGEQGNSATIGSIDTETKTLESGMKASVEATISGTNINFVFEIPQGEQGPVGPRGPAGEKGDIGETGPQGPQGETAYSIEILGTLSDISLLPSPSSVARNSGYLVGASAPYDLYIIVGSNSLNWLNAGGFSPNQITVDTFLSTSSTNPVQNKIITEALNNFSQYFVNINLCDNSQIVNNTYIDTDGTTKSITGYFYTGNYIPVEVGKTYMWPYTQDAKGETYDSSKTRIGAIQAGGTGVSTISPYSFYTAQPGVSFIRVNSFRGGSVSVSNFMVVEGSSSADYPSEFVEYGTTLENIKLGDDIVDDIENMIDEKVPGTTTIQSVNLFNPNASDITDGKYMTQDGNMTTFSSGIVSGYIPIDITKSYIFPVATGFYGNSNVNVVFYNANKQRVGALVGTSSGVSLTSFTSDDYGTFNIMITGVLNTRGSLATAKYARFTAFKSSYGPQAGGETKYMFVEGSSASDYPTSYVPYEYYKTLNDEYGLNELQLEQAASAAVPNRFAGKKIVFDGDSICHATSAGATDGGWAKRIGVANDMIWYNKGISGGTIAKIPGDSERHIISESWESYPADLDYIILEGGTNDADVLNRLGLGLGTFDPTDWSGSYDNTTFSGAMEYMLYNVLQHWPNAKVGFIVAQKMGYSNSSTMNYGTGNKRYDAFVRAMEICKKWAIPVINLWDESDFNPMLSAQYVKGGDAAAQTANGSLYTDGQHLTSIGYDKIWTSIDAFMKSL